MKQNLPGLAAGKKISGKSAVDRVMEFVVESVRKGQLVPGQRLVESDFTLLVGASRSVVREAFQRLISEGLLGMERHRGVRVREITAKDIKDIFAVRVVLDGLAARLATPRLAADPRGLLACHDRFEAAVSQGDMSQFIECNDQFHNIIFEACDNPVLSDAARRLGNTVRQLDLRFVLSRKLITDSLLEHQRLVKAIVAGEAKAACKLAEDHQLKAQRRLLALWGSTIGPTARSAGQS